jgi:hypothetical protein
MMVLGELAQAAADGRSDVAVDEVGMLFASRSSKSCPGGGGHRRKLARSTGAGQ